MIELNNISLEIDNLSNERYAAMLINTDQIYILGYYNQPTSYIQLPQFRPIDYQKIDSSVEYSFEVRVTNESLGQLCDQFLQSIILISLQYELVNSVDEINAKLENIYNDYDTNHGNPDPQFPEYVRSTANYLKNTGELFLHPISFALTMPKLVTNIYSRIFDVSDENQIRLNKFDQFVSSGLRANKCQIYRGIVRQFIIVYCELKKNFSQGNCASFTFNALNGPAFISNIQPIHPVDSLGILFDSLRRMSNIVINGINTNSYSNFKDVRDIYVEYMGEIRQREIFREGLEAIDQISDGQNVQKVIADLTTNRIVPGSKNAEKAIINKATILAITLMRMVVDGRGLKSKSHFDLFGLDTISNAASSTGEDRIYDKRAIQEINSNIIMHVTTKISALENKKISRIGNFDQTNFVDSTNKYYQKITAEYEKKKKNFQDNMTSSISEIQRLAITEPSTDVNNLQQQLDLTNRIASMDLKPFKNLVKSYNKFIPIKNKYDEMSILMNLVHWYDKTDTILRDQKNVGISIKMSNFKIDPISLYLPL